jgi:hypothetical protein
MPKKPIDTLTWKKNDKYLTIDKFYHQIIIINKDTGKTEISITEVSEIPPITRKPKPKHK